MVEGPPGEPADGGGGEPWPRTDGGGFDADQAEPTVGDRSAGAADEFAVAAALGEVTGRTPVSRCIAAPGSMSPRLSDHPQVLVGRHVEQVELGTGRGGVDQREQLDALHEHDGLHPPPAVPQGGADIGSQRQRHIDRGPESEFPVERLDLVQRLIERQAGVAERERGVAAAGEAFGGAEPPVPQRPADGCRPGAGGGELQCRDGRIVHVPTLGQPDFAGVTGTSDAHIVRPGGGCRPGLQWCPRSASCGWQARSGAEAETR